MIALGAALSGLGWVAASYTDTLWGLYATYGLLCWCGLSIAWRASDLFGQLLVIGLVFLIGVQVFINVGVATMVLPNKGLSLPFISYGGTNLVIMGCMVGLVLNCIRESAQPAFVAKEARA